RRSVTGRNAAGSSARVVMSFGSRRRGKRTDYFVWCEAAGRTQPRAVGDNCPYPRTSNVEGPDVRWRVAAGKLGRVPGGERGYGPVADRPYLTTGSVAPRTQRINSLIGNGPPTPVHCSPVNSGKRPAKTKSRVATRA